METKTVIKILSWNIKGFRETIDGTKTNKFMETEVIDLFCKHDIVICQETHLDRDSAKEIVLPDFSPGVHYCRQKRAKAQSASGGISIFIKQELRKYVKFLPQSNSDIVWMMIKRNNTSANVPDSDTYIGCVYIPPEFSSFGRDHTKDIWDQLEKDTEHFSIKGNVILCGDFNARTGNLEDFIQMDDDNDVYDIQSNFMADCVHKRHSSDKVVQKYGRKLVEICIDDNMYILNGRTLGDLQGNSTCFSSRGHSVVDYFVCSQNLIQKVLKLHVNNLTMFSDHCPIELNIHLPLQRDSGKKNRSKYPPNKELRNQHQSSGRKETDPHYSFFWEDDSAEKILSALDTATISNQIKHINNNIIKEYTENKEPHKEEIDKHVTDLTNTIISAAKLSVKHKVKTNKSNRNKRGKKWFTHECYVQRKEVRSLLNALNRHHFRKDIQKKILFCTKDLQPNCQENKDCIQK